MAVANYDPALLEFWRAAYKGEIPVELDNAKDAFRLRTRLYRLRKDMQAERHPDWHLAKKASIRLEGATLTGHPADDQFAEALAAAGIVVGEGEELSTEAAMPISAEQIYPAPSSMADAIAVFRESEDDA